MSSTWRRIAVVIAAAAAGCASLRLQAPRLTPEQSAIDRALTGTWTDARMTPLGPVWMKFALACDCSYRARVQALFFRLTERGQYQVAGDQFYSSGNLAELSGITGWPAINCN